MLKLFVIIAVVIAVVAADEYDREWLAFKVKYNKQYSPKEEVARRFIYSENMKHVEEHNALYYKGLSTYILGENEYADMTTPEFVTMMNGAQRTLTLDPTNRDVKPMADLPTSVDWRTKGYVTGVKNQGQCGSCWAFSTTGAIEGQHFKTTGNLVSLSESNLVDCAGGFGNLGCDGGFPFRAFQYVIHSHGIDTEQTYPYTPHNERCRFNVNNVGATISNYTRLPSGSESALQEAVAQIGPVSVCVDASHTSFHMYRSGIYYERNCSSKRLDHAILAVGYGTEDGQDYWLVKNSWGMTWGIDGYIKMIRNQNNNCGIASDASYPIV